MRLLRLRQNFLTRILEDNIKALIKPQYVDAIPKAVQGDVGTLLEGKNERGVKEELLEALDLVGLTERQVGQLSGGELQRFAIGMVAAQRADIYMFDEPSSYHHRRPVAAHGARLARLVVVELQGAAQPGEVRRRQFHAAQARTWLHMKQGSSRSRLRDIARAGP